MRVEIYRVVWIVNARPVAIELGAIKPRHPEPSHIHFIQLIGEEEFLLTIDTILQQSCHQGRVGTEFVPLRGIEIRLREVSFVVADNIGWGSMPTGYHIRKVVLNG